MSVNRTEARPTLAQLDEELKRLGEKKSKGKLIVRIAAALLLVAAAAVLVAVLWLPVLQVVGDSMAPTLADGEVVITVKSGSSPARGDVIAFYYNDRILIKRVIGIPGDEISINADGDVYINGEAYDEPYLTEKSAGLTDVSFPLTVEPGVCFVLGDNREISMDSRLGELGTIRFERIIGKVILRVLPLQKIGGIS